MDVPAEILEELKCGQCSVFLSRAPVYQQRDGAAACGRCFSPKRPATRNNQYETLAKLVRFLCKNKDLGCRETVAFADEGQDDAHEAVCEYRQYVCPVLGSSRCDWLGPSSQILQHCRAQHPGHEFVTCAGCGAVTRRLYRDAGGWRCELCAPARRACENQAQGCTYQDFPDKCRKHELYFCQQRPWCWICHTATLCGTLAAHYASAHVTHSAGSTWRATAEGWLYCLVTCPAGTAVCCHWLDDSQLEFRVHIPVPSERLCEFRCEVRVTQPTTGLTSTYTPDINYQDVWDWKICLEEDDFPDWDCELNVCVNISSI